MEADQKGTRGPKPGHIKELREANEAFSEANDALSNENDQLRQQLEAMKSALAKNNPVSISQRLETDDLQIGQDGTAHFDKDGVLVHVEQRTLDDPFLAAKIKELAFMEELVTVEIADTAEEQADIGFVISVQNKPETFMRGQQKTVKRKFVEGLARAKKTAFGNVLTVDPVNGEQAYVHPSKTGLRYPFSVIRDDNPRGREWLHAVLRQP